MWSTFLFGLAVFFSRCLELHVQCQTICKADQYTIVTSNGSFRNCLNCATCHPGRGLYPICGSTITYPPNNIDCKSCPAETFSNHLDSAPCHSCQTCTDHEIIAAPCTNVSDRACSGTCEKGYFFAKKAPHNCQQCSYCCFDGKDEKQMECIKQGLNATGRHCSARLDKQCGPNPTTAVTTSATQRSTTQMPTTAVTTSATQRSTTQITTQMPTQRPTHLSTHQQNTTSSPVPTKHTVTIIVLSVLSGLFLVALLLVLFKKKSLCGRKRTECHSPDVRVEFNTDEENRANQTQGNNSNYASQGLQSAANPRIQELQNTGYASSNSATPEASPCASPQHTDDELDDLPDVTVRNKHRVKRQSSRESQSNASKDGASESLLDPNVEATNNGILQPNGNNKDSKGGGQGRPTVSRRQSLEALKRKFSFSFEKDDYQPLGREDPDDELQGDDEAGPKMRKRGSLSFIESLKRKCSLPEKEDYQPVKKEDPASTTRTEPIKVELEPMHQEQKEGSRVEFMCNVHGKSEVFYQWFKDDTEIPGQNNSNLVLDCVEMCDFGCYACQVSDADGPCGCGKSQLDVVPRDGMDYKCLGAIDPNTQKRVVIRLTKNIHGLGGWREVAYKYKMDDLMIDSLEGDPNAGKELISHLEGKYPDLKVYEFCKTLKEPNILRNDIIKELLGNLTAPSSEDTA